MIKGTKNETVFNPLESLELKTTKPDVITLRILVYLQVINKIYLVRKLTQNCEIL